ncbi:MAG: REP-associated tyrosine transposase [Opitutaceae bacterium]
MGFKPHLRRLQHVWIEHPCYFVTTCVQGRRPILATPLAQSVLVEEWRRLADSVAWQVGPYVIMPDHVHFFATPAPAASRDLSYWIGRWKRATATRLNRFSHWELPFWQPGFFDHVLRSAASRGEKWDYLRQNPVRAGLVTDAAQWPYMGSVHFQ